jgi:hypothetical protein
MAVAVDGYADRSGRQTVFGLAVFSAVWIPCWFVETK